VERKPLAAQSGQPNPILHTFSSCYSLPEEAKQDETARKEYRKTGNFEQAGREARVWLPSV
jgi:hypothetical protein